MSSNASYCIIVSSNLRRSSLNRESKTTQNSLRKSLKLTRITRPLPARLSNKNLKVPLTQEAGLQSRLFEKLNCKDSWDQTADSKEQKPAELPRQSLDKRYLERTLTYWVIYRLWNVLQVPRFCELTSVLRWALMTELSLSHFCSCK